MKRKLLVLAIFFGLLVSCNGNNPSINPPSDDSGDISDIIPGGENNNDDGDDNQNDDDKDDQDDDQNDDSEDDDIEGPIIII